MLVVVSGDGLQLPHGDAGWWGFAVMLGAFLVAFVAFYQGIRLIGPVRMATIMNIEPVVTIAFAVLLLGEGLSPRHVIGTAIVLAGIFLAQYSRLRSLRHPESPGI